MALTSTEEAQIRQLIAQLSALLSLAGNEPSITSKLGATEVSLSDLAAASSINTNDLLLARQGTTDKSLTALLLKNFMASQLAGQFVDVAGDTMTGALALVGDSTATTQSKADNTTKIATTAHVKSVVADYLTTVSAIATYLSQSTAASTYAPIVSPWLTGNPLAPTPALFDNDISIATTEFVKSNGHAVAGVVAISATSATLDTNHANKLVVYAGASNGAFTLPARSTYPAGTVIKFFNLTSTNALTLVRAGTDTINASGTSIVVSYGETLTLIASSSAGIWLTADGSAMLRAVTNNGFLNSLTSNGYQLLPNGLIIQWGTTGSVVANSVVNQSFPITFPSNCFCVTASPVGSFSNANAAGLGIAKSTSAISIYNWGASINYSGGVMWIALGN